eukprot:5088192-Prymnesium_polylepis.1
MPRVGSGAPNFAWEPGLRPSEVLLELPGFGRSPAKFDPKVRPDLPKRKSGWATPTSGRSTARDRVAAAATFGPTATRRRGGTQPDRMSARLRHEKHKQRGRRGDGGGAPTRVSARSRPRCLTAAATVTELSLRRSDAYRSASPFWVTAAVAIAPLSRRRTGAQLSAQPAQVTAAVTIASLSTRRSDAQQSASPFCVTAVVTIASLSLRRKDAYCSA